MVRLLIGSHSSVLSNDSLFDKALIVYLELGNNGRSGQALKEIVTGHNR